jgi:hypothetical protein
MSVFLRAGLLILAFSALGCSVSPPTQPTSENCSVVMYEARFKPGTGSHEYAELPPPKCAIRCVWTSGYSEQSSVGFATEVPVSCAEWEDKEVVYHHAK